MPTKTHHPLLTLVPPHEVQRMATRRGDPPHLDREMGFLSTGQRARSFCRPPEADDNLETGQPSKLSQWADRELLAHDRVNPEGADTLVAGLLYRLGLQRAVRAGVGGGDSWVNVSVSLIEAFCALLVALMHLRESQAKTKDVAEKAIKLSAAANRTLVFLEFDCCERPPADEGAMRRAA